MHQQLPIRNSQTWKEKLLRSGYFLGALLLHLVVFVMLGTIVIWTVPAPRNDDEFHSVAVKAPPPPPPQPPSAGDAARNPQFEPEQLVVPMATPASVIAAANNNNFSINTSKDLTQALTQVSQQMAQGAGLTRGAGNTGAGAGVSIDLFGSFSGSANFLQGTVYDLKIKPNHTPTGMNQATYTNLLHSFLVKGWDESVLAPFYKASKRLFTPAIWIATTKSEDCAKEMHLDNELSSTYWVGWYHTKITPSQAGSFRFVGFGDDILLVAVNGQTVLDGSLWPVAPVKQTMPWPDADWSVFCKFKGQNYGKLRVGDSFVVNTLEPVTIDVLMGDEPGGWYNAFLLIADNGKKYPISPEGVPQYPIFQIGSDPVKRTGDQPPHASQPEPWAVQ
jgi:hypothetical protein